MLKMFSPYFRCLCILLLCGVVVYGGKDKGEQIEGCPKKLKCRRIKKLTGYNQVRCCGIKDGVKKLLSNRDDDWSWGERVEAEAIIGLHLGRFSTFDKKNSNVYISVKQMNIDLLSALSQDRNLTSTTWSRGKLGHYVLGFLSTCQDPRDFYGHNLVETLNYHLTLSASYFDNNKFAYALVVIALCKSGEPIEDSVLSNLSTTPGQYTFGVAAMVYLAYECVNNTQFNDNKSAALDFILNSQDQDGLFGNEYSTALALQAIFASGDSDLKPRTKNGIVYIAKSVLQDKNPYTSLLLSVLPALGERSLLDVGYGCVTQATTTTTTINPTQPIVSFGIKVTNNLTTDNYDESWVTAVREGQTLYDGMVNLQDTDETFSFQSTSSTFGEFITSINNMTASSDDRQYWQIIDKDGVPLQQGVSQTIPSKNDSFQFNLTTW